MKTAYYAKIMLSNQDYAHGVIALKTYFDLSEYVTVLSEYINLVFIKLSTNE